MKVTVEQCRILDIKQFTHDRTLQPQIHRYGRLLRFAYGMRVVEFVEYELDTRDENNLWLQLSYTLTQPRKLITSRITLEVTQPHYGGLRWWLKCPSLVNGSPCDRRMQKLYRPPEKEYFFCRQCWDLTYTSCQTSHMFDHLETELTARYRGVRSRI